MEHLPYPSNAAHPPLRIPNLISAETVVDCCTQWPVDRWNQDASQRRARSLKERTKLLQQWLYFGLISRCIQEPVFVQDFSDDGQLNSKELPRLLRGHLETIQADEEVERILQAVELELRTFTGFFEPGFRVNTEQDNAERVVLSIRVLTDSLRRIYRNRGEYAEVRFMRHDERYENPFAPAGLYCTVLQKRMSWQDGWCASRVSSLLQTLTASTVYYLSAIRRYKIGAADHRYCTSDRCRLHYDEIHYRQVHTRQCQHNSHTYCKMVQAPLDEVMSILQNGGIPLLRLNQDCLIASRAKYGMPYVAATYVWAGGLGNPKGNAMWLCQLQEISQLTSSSKRAIRHFEPSLSPLASFLPSGRP